MNPSIKASEPPRLPSLDALRGVAAVIVVFHHFTLALEEHTPTFGVFLLHGTLSILMAGRLAVLLFFVLSGFVLTLPYRHGQQQRYLAFAARRVVRLYVPYGFAVILSCVLYVIFRDPAEQFAAIFQNKSWGANLTPVVFGEHLAMTGFPLLADHFNPPIWSLIMEMRASLILPLIVLLVFRTSWLGVAATIVVAFAASKLRVTAGETASHLMSQTLLGSVLLTLVYVPYFAMGSMLAYRLEWFTRLVAQVPAPIHLILFLAVVLLDAAILDLNLADHGYSDIVLGLCSCYILLCCVAVRPVEAVLKTRFCLWLGRISFSLYLLHWPVIAVAMYLGDGRLPLWASAALGALAAFPLAHVMDRSVGQWSIRWSRAVGRRVEEWLRPVR